MKVYMLWDMEGTSGLFTREHVWYWEQGVREHIADEGRTLLMADVIAASAAALAAGVDELIVCDTHHGGGNIRLDEMLCDPRVTHHDKSRDEEGRWLPGLDETVDALMLPGHHAKAGSQSAFLPHTSTREWADFRINGQSVGEIGIEACYAGQWEVPLLMVQGDEAACAEAERQFPGIVTASVKRATGRRRASGPAPEVARQMTAQAIGQAVALAREGSLAPYKPDLPMAVRFTGTSTWVCEKIALRPGVRRIDGRTLEATVERQCDLLRWLVG